MKQHCRLVSLLVVCAALAGAAVAQPNPEITVALGDAVGNVGGSVEVPVYLTTGNAQPTVLILFLRYNPAKLAPFAEYYEFTFADALGNPVLDGQGNTITAESAVRPEPALDAADKLVETGVLPDGAQGGALPLGVFSIGIFGFDLAQQPIPDGKILTIGFRVLAGAAPNEVLLIEGVGTDDPILVGGELPFSNAADGSSPPSRVNVLLEDGTIALGCTPAPVPSNVQASQHRADGVLISWNAIAGPDAEYRVYRSTLADVNTALPLGPAWQSESSFLDITAAVPLRIGGGCTPSNSVITEYFYWVKARASGCESAFQPVGTPGFRIAGKALHTAGLAGGAVLLVLLGAALASGRGKA